MKDDKYFKIESLSKFNEYWLLNCNGYTPLKIIEQEKFLIQTLEVENNACKDCKDEAIRYHKAIISFMEEYIKKGGFIK